MSNNLHSDNIIQIIHEKLENNGFKPFMEFNLTDSYLNDEFYLAIYSFDKCSLIGRAVNHSENELAIELECEFQIKLLGKICEFSDFEQLSDLCQNFFCDLSSDRNIIISKIEMGKTSRNNTLRRLERNVYFAVRFCLLEE